MKQIVRLSVPLLVAALLAGCTSYFVDPKSAAYISTYRQEKDQTKLWDIAQVTTHENGAGLSDTVPVLEPVTHETVVETESGEHLLRFPARIGYTRLDAIYPRRPVWQIGNPAGEMQIRERTRLHIRIPDVSIEKIGELMPVNALEDGAGSVPTRLVSNSYSSEWKGIESIRIAAAHQNLDAVIIYRTFAIAGASRTWLSYLDYTIVGAFVIPSNVVRGQAVATAVIMDVRSGEIYDMATVSADKMQLSDSMSAIESQYSSEYVAYARATRELGSAVGEMLARMYAKQLRARAGLPS